MPQASPDQDQALTIGARYDEMVPTNIKTATPLPNATSAYCDKGSHLRMWDDQESYFRQLLTFLRTV